MNLVKSQDFFDPTRVTDRIHIIGCGAVGSTLAELLCRCGLTKITLWDFDIVEEKNIANQKFRYKDIGKLKTEALKDILEDVNPDISRDIVLENDGWDDQKLSGYVFLCPDSIDVRRKVVEVNKYNTFIKGIFDFRMRLTDAQHYAAEFGDFDSLLATMDFTHEEAAKETPVSACNVTLSVAYTVSALCSLGVSNFVNFVKDQELKKFMLVDVKTFDVEAF